MNVIGKQTLVFLLFLAIFSAQASPLWGADFFALCAGGSIEQVREALAEGVDVNARDAAGYTAFDAGD